MAQAGGEVCAGPCFRIQYIQCVVCQKIDRIVHDAYILGEKRQRKPMKNGEIAREHGDVCILDPHDLCVRYAKQSGMIRLLQGDFPQERSLP